MGEPEVGKGTEPLEYSSVNTSEKVSQTQFQRIPSPVVASYPPTKMSVKNGHPDTVGFFDAVKQEHEVC